MLREGEFLEKFVPEAVRRGKGRAGSLHRLVAEQCFGFYAAPLSSSLSIRTEKARGSKRRFF